MNIWLSNGASEVLYITPYLKRNNYSGAQTFLKNIDDTSKF